MAKSESVTYKGVVFRRYPDSENASDRSYYRPHAGYIRRGVEALHREIWKDHHGAIPEGHHIHHKDGNPLNNDIANLECLPAFDHLSAHGEDRELAQEHHERMLEAAAEWHRSAEGRAWHRQNAERSWKKREPVRLTCEQCAKAYETKHRGNARFCSNACKTAWRAASGLDDEQRECALCGATFTVNKYRKVRYCTRSCAAAARWQR